MIVIPLCHALAVCDERCEKRNEYFNRKKNLHRQRCVLSFYSPKDRWLNTTQFNHSSEYTREIRNVPSSQPSASSPSKSLVCPPCPESTIPSVPLKRIEEENGRKKNRRKTHTMQKQRIITPSTTYKPFHSFHHILIRRSIPITRFIG